MHKCLNCGWHHYDLERGQCRACGWSHKYSKIERLAQALFFGLIVVSLIVLWT